MSSPPLTMKECKTKLYQDCIEHKVTSLNAGFDFQCLDIKYVDKEPSKCRPSVTKNTNGCFSYNPPYMEDVSPTHDTNSFQEYKKTLCENKTNIFIFGRSFEGRSCSIQIKDYRPYFHVVIPNEWNQNQIQRLLITPLFEFCLDKIVDHYQYNISDFITWKVSTLKHKFYGFEPDKSSTMTTANYTQRKIVKVIQIEFRNKVLMQRATKILTRVWKTAKRDIYDKIEVCEYKVSDIIKFFDKTREQLICEVKSPGSEGKQEYKISHDLHGLEPSSWIHLSYPSETVQINQHERRTHCDIEIECNIFDLSPRPEIMKIAQYTIASVDIETFSAKDEFPCADNEGDCIICIGTVLKRLGTDSPPVKIIQYFGKYVENNREDIENTEKHKREKDPTDMIVFTYRSERDLLNAWREMIVYMDVDVLTGYNLHGFDYEYMYKRAWRMNAEMFYYSSKLIGEKTVIEKRTLSSSAMGQNEMHFLESMSGRITIDMFNLIKNSHKLKQYTLNSVSKHFLGEEKEDLPYKVMNNNYKSKMKEDAWKHWDIAFYCAQDCNLPLRLMEKLKTFVELNEMSKITMTPLREVLSRGQQIRVFNQIILEAHRMNNVVNDIPSFVGSDDKYVGATVIEPNPGFYKDPIVTLDFNSLYPSIMQTHNLCYSTWIPPHIVKELENVNNMKCDIEKTIEYASHETGSSSHTFVTEYEGVLPRILKTLLSARSSVRAQMKKTSCADEKALLNGRQLAYKISANSVYGFTGAKDKGMYPGCFIAETTTCEGRNLIHITKEMVENKGYTVIYGDTDSVMIRFNIDEGDPDAISKSFKLGTEMATWITSQFPGEIVLEMEKTYFPYILIAKKRYAGLMFSSETGTPKIDMKGIEIVRRDTCTFARTIMQDVLDKILYERNIPEATMLLKTYLNLLCENKIEFSDFILTKALRIDYANQNLPHLEVVRKMKERKLQYPRPGDRVSFVYIENKKKKAFQKAEDPNFVLENPAVKIDRLYYLEHQLINSLSTLYESFDKTDKDLLKNIFNETVHELKRQTENMCKISTYFQPTPIIRQSTSPQTLHNKMIRKSCDQLGKAQKKTKITSWFQTNT